MGPSFIETNIRLFGFYKSLGEQAMQQVGDEQLSARYNDDSNSIAVIVNHLWGNMLSRWTDFLNSDGEKDWRDRDAEFEHEITDRRTLLEKWEAGWACLFGALATLTENDLGRTIHIRGQGQTVLDAISRQLAHYSYHVGQIVFLAKMYTQSDWQTLSIAKGDSKSYNAKKFAQAGTEQHFTQEFIEKKSKGSM